MPLFVFETLTLNIQSLFNVHPIPMTATASSFSDGSQWGFDWQIDMAINGIQDGSDYDDLFHSNGENFPWLAIDLGFFYKVILPTEICAFTESFARSQGCQWWSGVVAVLTEIKI